MSAAQASGAPRVLVVDDEPSIGRALAIAFRRAGFESVAALGGEEAEARLREGRFDALVLDLRMPDLRGDVVYHSAVSLQPHLAHATLFVTGDVTEKGAELVAACGCPLLSKPFVLAEVVEIVVGLVGGRRSGVA